TAGRAEDDARWLGPPPNVRLALYSVLAVLFAMLGRRSDSYGALDEILVLFDDPGGGYRRDSPFYAFYRMFAVRLADWHDDSARVERLASELDRITAPDTGMLRVLLQAERLVLPGRLAWQRGQWREARVAFENALAHEAALRVFGEDVEIRLRLALACLRLADVDAAVRAIAPVFETAEREGAPGGVLAGPKSVLDALADAPWNGRLAAARLAALRRWAAIVKAPADLDIDAARARADDPVGTRSGTPVLVAAEALSPRELDVLKLIAAGDSNKLIARAYDLSPHTVKRHVANILDKLGVQSRGQAAAWYNERRAT
ncbi:MAG TPA: helix-turn-helix transcriptional regulator, partial [Caldimonas sp.]|nr:helix-turn-helix transcriptional regulator [Caldimonas sp.]